MGLVHVPPPITLKRVRQGKEEGGEASYHCDGSDDPWVCVMAGTFGKV